MKIKRHKRFQKTVQFFIKNFDWKPPFNLLIDGTFAKAALDNKVNLRDQLPKYFDDSIKLYTTPCCLVETEKIGPELYGALQVLKSFLVFKCPHAEAPISATSCIIFMSGMEHHRANYNNKYTKKSEQDNVKDDKDVIKFIPATQDNNLRRELRLIPGVPLLYLNGPAPTFEKPSNSTQDEARVKNTQKLELLCYQREILMKMKKEAFGEFPTSERKGTKKRKRVGPNPLSCKKSSKKKKKITTSRSHAVQLADSSNSGGGAMIGGTIEKKIKKRTRVKIPKHVKEEIFKFKRRQDETTLKITS